MKKNNIKKNESQEKDGLFELLKAYGESEGMQSPDRAAIDPQLKCFSLHLAEYFQSNKERTVIDIGCGRGVLLNRIASIPAFFENPNWIYVGTDFPVNHDKVLEVAVKIRLHRRVDVIDTDTFLKDWTNNLLAPTPDGISQAQLEILNRTIWEY